MSRKAYIVGTGHMVPDRILTNEYLAKLKKSNGEYVFEKKDKPISNDEDIQAMVEETNDWIVKNVGIVERRMADDDTSVSDLALEACRNAMQAADWTAEDVDGVIVGTVTPDYVFPNTAAIVADRLGLNKVPAYDFEAGCSGFIYGLIQAKAFIESGIFDNVLVVGAECLTKITNYELKDCSLFGDGAGAIAVSSQKHKANLSGEISSWDWGSDGSMGMELIQLGGGSRNPTSRETLNLKMHCIKMNGQAIFKTAVHSMKKTALNALTKEEKSAEDVPLRKKNIVEVILKSRVFDYPRKWGWIQEFPGVKVHLLIPHQANRKIITQVAKRLKIEMDDVFVNIEKYGNTSSASIPIALDESLRSGRIQDKNTVVLAAFGAGLTWGAVVLKWSKFVPRRRFISMPRSTDT